jgi:hypothetical protein
LNRRFSSLSGVNSTEEAGVDENNLSDDGFCGEELPLRPKDGRAPEVGVSKPFRKAPHASPRGGGAATLPEERGAASAKAGRAAEAGRATEAGTSAEAGRAAVLILSSELSDAAAEGKEGLNRRFSSLSGVNSTEEAGVDENNLSDDGFCGEELPLRPEDGRAPEVGVSKPFRKAPHASPRGGGAATLPEERGVPSAKAGRAA